MKTIVLNMLKKASTKIEVDINTQSVFVEGEHNGWHILLENTHIENEYAIQIHCDNMPVLFSREEIEEIETWIYEYAAFEIHNAYNPASIDDHLHAERLIFNL